MADLDTLDENKLRQMFPAAGSRLTPHLPYIVDAMGRWNIDNFNRIAMFLAQLAHESSEYRYMEEIADGSDYEGRLDLGNTEPGDGVKFKGHGPIQITGRANHRACGEALGLDLENEPTLITLPEHGTEAAAWFWTTHLLNPVADQNWIRVSTRIINGGYNGLSDRMVYWNRNRQVLGLPWVDNMTEDRRVRAYQSTVGLVADGIVGPMTLASLSNV
jgi:predicted chitinase